MELLLLRHAKSDWRVAAGDFDRPLKPRGVREAKRLGRWLRQQQLLPDLVISSPAVRAAETARLCLEKAGLKSLPVQMDDRLYLASTATLLDCIFEVSGKVNCLMLVGHNPGMEMLLEELVDGSPCFPDGKVMPTATLAWLRGEPGSDYVLVEHVRGRELPTVD